MAAKRFDPGREFLDQAQISLKKTHLPRIVKCLNALSERDIWWRPNEASNCAGNLVLHLAGNVRQRITSSIGGAPDVRNREREFSERGPLPRRGLIALLQSKVNEACRVLARTPGDSLGAPFGFPGQQMTRMEAIFRTVEHFSLHAGQIAYIAKLKTARDLGLTRLPRPSVVTPAKPSRRKPRGVRSRKR